MSTVERQVAATGEDTQWERLWFAALQSPWGSLAVIPATRGTSTAALARRLAEVAKVHRESEVHLLNAEGIRLADALWFVDGVNEHCAHGDRAILSLDSPLANNAAIPIARATDAVILVVTLGDTRFADAARTLDLVGRERFIGAVTVRAD